MVTVLVARPLTNVIVNVSGPSVIKSFLGLYELFINTGTINVPVLLNPPSKSLSLTLPDIR